MVHKCMIKKEKKILQNYRSVAIVSRDVKTNLGELRLVYSFMIELKQYKKVLTVVLKYL